MGELADTLVPDRSALGHNLRPLQRDGLIALVAGDADRRLRRVVLTTKGVAKLREARRGWKEAQAQFDDVLGETAQWRPRVTLLPTPADEPFAALFGLPPTPDPAHAVPPRTPNTVSP